MSPRVNPVKDYLRSVGRDAARSDEDRQYLSTQAARLLAAFHGASFAELHRLRAALELLEVGRDRGQPWDVRGPALDRGARLLQGLGLIPRRHKGATVPARSRRTPRPIFTLPPAGASLESDGDGEAAAGEPTEQQTVTATSE